MRVMINPGTHSEDQCELRVAVLAHDVFRNGEPARHQLAALIELLVEKGVLTLADCRTLGAPHMEEVK